MWFGGGGGPECRARTCQFYSFITSIHTLWNTITYIVDGDTFLACVTLELISTAFCSLGATIHWFGLGGGCGSGGRGGRRRKSGGGGNHLLYEVVQWLPESSQFCLVLIQSDLFF
uniref:Uncharacterized protein n=1 Tax=Cacopsylla melanoneura TaxID=428564 RepID=A0A8D8LHQ8_9HEMI